MVTTRKTNARVTSASHRRPARDPELPVTKFFKLVLPSTIQKKMMKIPARFVNLVGSRLSDRVTLETPVGFKRSIKLKRIGEEIWFDKGWSEFADAHSITEGHFLYFEYMRKSKFRLVIFDVSACEINYPLDSVHISDSDDDIIDITDRGCRGTQGAKGNEGQAVNGGGGSQHNKPEKRPRDDEFEKILKDVDAINFTEAEKDERVFRGKQFF